MGCKVDINSCTDACTHSKQGVATEMRWLRIKHTAIQGHPVFHQTMQCVVHPLCIVWWKPGCPCMAVCLIPSHIISVATPCLECVHVSVHEFMSTLHPMSGPPPMDSYTESWVPLYVTLSMSQSVWLRSYTLFRMCTCISTWIYVQLAAYVWSTPYA